MELKQLHTDNQDFFLGYAVSRIGGRNENQDSYGVAQTNVGWVFTVCDGMGGGPGGKTASSIAVREIIASIDTAPRDEEPSNILLKAINRANKVIYETAVQTPHLQGMGSTATVLLISEYSAIIAHVGDSRVYQLRGKRKCFRTFDHSMVFGLVSQGVITEEQARLSAQSNIITRALGIDESVDVDVVEVSYEKGDRFMLCTDGIHGAMPEQELIRMATSRQTALAAVTDNIATYVDDLGRLSGGGHDNLTLAIIESKITSKLKSPMSKTTKGVILLLVVLCIMSLCTNFVQYSNNVKGDQFKQALVDSTMSWSARDSLWRDSVKKLHNSIDSIKHMETKKEKKQKENN